MCCWGSACLSRNCLKGGKVEAVGTSPTARSSLSVTSSLLRVLFRVSEKLVAAAGAAHVVGLAVVLHCDVRRAAAHDTLGLLRAASGDAVLTTIHGIHTGEQPLTTILLFVLEHKAFSLRSRVHGEAVDVAGLLVLPLDPQGAFRVKPLIHLRGSIFVGWGQRQNVFLLRHVISQFATLEELPLAFGEAHGDPGIAILELPAPTDFLLPRLGSRSDFLCAFQVPQANEILDFLKGFLGFREVRRTGFLIWFRNASGGCQNE